MGPAAKIKESAAPADPEAELGQHMTGYLEGRLEAFDALHAALSGRLRGYLVSLCRDAATADDLLQETFLQIHRSRRTYEPGRPVTPWAFAIARHVYLMHRRRTARRLRFEDTLLVETRRQNAPRDDAGALAERDEVRRALSGVPADQRRAMLMHHVEGHSFAEIAGQLGVKVNAAKTRAFRGMRRMRDLLSRSK